MRREPNDDEVFACLQAFWNEFQRWRVMAFRRDDTTLYKAVRDQFRLTDHTPEQAVALMSEPVEWLDLDDEHAARSYIQHRAMKAALIHFAAPSRKAQAGATSQL